MSTIPRFVGGVLAAAVLVVTVVAYDLRVARGSDHQDSPTVLARPAADITDVFVYPNPNDASRVVFQMNVDPLLTPGAATSGAALDPAVLYQFKIAHGAQTGQAEDTVIQFLANGAGPTQTISVFGPIAPARLGTTTVPSGTPQSVPFNTPTTLAGGVQVFVGPRSDPFFIDLAQLFKILPDRNYANQPNPPAATATSFRGFTAGFNTANGTACDTTPASDTLSSNGFNVLSIVIEMPKSLLTSGGQSPLINVWATTSTQSGS
jgi:hypothetical protein